MNRFLPLIVLFLLLLTSCEHQNTITFTAIIEQIGEGSLLVKTPDESLGFETASVRFPDKTLPRNLSVGQVVEVVALPEIQESYPVQVTAVNITQKESPMAEYKKITPQEALSMMQDHAIILDVRTKAEYEEGHIPNAVLLTDTEIKSKAEELLPDKQSTILVYCRSGRRSAEAAKELVQMGYTNVYDFGGILDWPGDVVK